MLTIQEYLFFKVMHVIDLKKNSSLQCDTQIKYYKK